MGLKHALTKVIFSKLYLDMHDTTLVNNHDLTPGISGLIEAELHTRTYYRRSDTLSGWEDDSWNEQGWNSSRPFLRKGLRSTIFPTPTYSAGP